MCGFVLGRQGFTRILHEIRSIAFYKFASLFVLAVAISLFYEIRASYATSITEEQSRNAVVNWIALSGEQLEGKLSGDILDTSDISASDGTVVARIHNIVGGGYVVTAVDDAMEPVLCFSNTGYLAASSGNPLLDILIYDMGKRLSQYYGSTKKKCACCSICREQWLYFYTQQDKMAEPVVKRFEEQENADGFHCRRACGALAENAVGTGGRPTRFAFV